MFEDTSILSFLLAALAAWRLTHLFAEEDGPWDLIVRLRAKLGSNILGRLMDCFYCLSLWTAIPFALWLSIDWITLLIQWPALSGAACLLERLTRKKEQSYPNLEPITLHFHHSVQQGEPACAAVRDETR